jgi:hypothetical protein
MKGRIDCLRDPVCQRFFSDNTDVDIIELGYRNCNTMSKSSTRISKPPKRTQRALILQGGGAPGAREKMFVGRFDFQYCIYF